jgi:hypothetical protein
MAHTANTRTRRSILGAALGAVAASVAAALGRTDIARANNGDPMLAGNTYSATDTTGVSTDTGNGLQGIFNGPAFSSSGCGVYGEANGSYNAYGVYGNNTQGYGVGILGEAGQYSSGVEGKGGTGVYGHSTTSGGGIGVNAGADGAGAWALYAHTYGGRAVYAFTDPGTGVYVDANGMAIDAVGKGGATVPAMRVVGAGNTPAIVGYSGPGAAPSVPARTGVFGVSDQGVGGRFASNHGLALLAVGPVHFKTSGKGTVLLNHRSVTVTPGVVLNPSSKVLALLQGNAGGSTTVQHVVLNQTANTFTIVLTAPTTADVLVAWFLMN